MIYVADAGGLLLDLYLLIEIICHAPEIGNHHFEIVDLLPFLFVLKSLILL